MENGGYGQMIPSGAMGGRSLADVNIGSGNENKPISPVQSEMRNLERAISRLDTMIAQLAGRVEPVCFAEGPSTLGLNTPGEVRARANSGLGGHIASCSDQVDGLSIRVSGLLKRCEL